MKITKSCLYFKSCEAIQIQDQRETGTRDPKTYRVTTTNKKKNSIYTRGRKAQIQFRSCNSVGVSSHSHNQTEQNNASDQTRGQDSHHHWQSDRAQQLTTRSIHSIVKNLHKQAGNHIKTSLYTQVWSTIITSNTGNGWFSFQQRNSTNILIYHQV